MSKARGALRKFGSNWGGWRLDPTKIDAESTIISAGISHDATFDHAVLTAFPKARVVCIDPTPLGVKTATTLATQFEGRVDVIPKALAPEGCVELSIGGSAISELTASPTDPVYETITLSAVLDSYDDISVFKCDIEGSEYSILGGLKDDAIPQLCIEWHHWLSPNTLSLSDTLDAIRYIESLGYYEIERKTNESWRVLQESFFMKSSLF